MEARLQAFLYPDEGGTLDQTFCAAYSEQIWDSRGATDAISHYLSIPIPKPFFEAYRPLVQ